MIEIIVKDYLKSQLDVPVFLEDPGPSVKSFVLIEKIGGGEQDYINLATLAIQSYADSLANAALLNEIVKGKMRDIIELNDISSCKLDTDYNWTDTDTKRYRYQAVYNFVYY